MPKVPNVAQRSNRQDPVSCSLCRSKKLKCDRTSPCSNCRARKLECVYQSRPQSSAEVEGSCTRSATTISILERLQRLEELVIPRPTPHSKTEQQSRVSVPTIHTSDYEWLESVSIRKNTIFTSPYKGVDIRIGPHVSNDDIKQIVLPPQQSASALFEDYSRLVNPLQHVFHVPSAQRTLDSVYKGLEKGQTSDLGSIALLLAMFASVASICVAGSDTSYEFESQQEATQACADWTNAAVDAMEYSRRLTPGTIEDVQASVILQFLLFQNEGFSPRVRIMHANGYTLARHLGLHRTDAPSKDSRTSLQQWQIIEIESKRRLWWHITITDWLLSFSGGPCEGVYSIQKTHMAVEKPRNITDEDLSSQALGYSRPLSEPTTMGYYFHRIRLGELCKEIADSNWSLLATSEPSKTEYDEIIELDKGFKKLSHNLPEFLRLDRDSSSFDQDYPYLATQRYFANLTIHGRRCKFNIPFMLRVSQNPLFEYSRCACLRSARYVLELSNVLENEMSDMHPLINMRSAAVIHLIFYATTVLVMDLCVNRDLGDEAEKRNEASKACQILERAREQSPVASAFLDSLMSIVRKHNLRVPIQGKGRAESTGPSAVDQMLPAVDDALLQNTTGPTENSEFDWWQDYFDYAPQDAEFWDSLFYDLDMKIG